MQLERIEQFQDAAVTVMGLGKYKEGSGFVTVTWLIKHGAQTVVTDLKTEADLQSSLQLLMEWYREYRTAHPEANVYPPVFVLGEHRKEDFTDVDYVVQNPGVPSETAYMKAAEEAGVDIESDTSIFLRFYPYKTIAVTGTKGKTTTTKLLGEMLNTLHPSAIVAGNVKASPLQFLDGALEKKEEIPVVLEFSSWMLLSLPYALQDLGRGPDIAVLTNVYPDHMDRYPDYEAYKKSKEIIFAYQTPDQVAILNKDHAEVREMASRVPSRLLWFSTAPMEEDGCFIENGIVKYRREGGIQDLLAVDDVALKGEHNLSNALAAACAALVRGVPLAGVAEVLKRFSGIADRQEVVREVDEVTYVNDTASTAPEALKVALETLGTEKRIVLLAGGDSRGVSFDAVAPVIAHMCKQVLLFPGTATEALEKALLGRVMVDHVQTMEEAVKMARKFAARGDVVLFSPGCPVGQPFANEFEAGEAFREEVRKI
ncbi:UDP-N-acetylmuramoyl-L-alanine--D-glutamate ligase [bacterium]|nr:UDP-N-acetylmuramoyl-L-alanine--D-glutamate ligase [bacterium]NBX49795.1 UDP-N-acetylmuramoyl-L-alanine--D-glutamate ligase [bacterium]